jgi:hypothetical protein
MIRISVFHFLKLTYQQGTLVQFYRQKKDFVDILDVPGVKFDKIKVNSRQLSVLCHSNILGVKVLTQCLNLFHRHQCHRGYLS